jgi:hypothetical protein
MTVESNSSNVSAKTVAVYGVRNSTDSAAEQAGAGRGIDFKLAARTPNATLEDPLFPNLITNPLKKYASYTYVWSLSCLTKSQHNNPSSYRYNDSALDFMVLGEGGYTGDPVSQNGKGNRVSTAYGSPEYFINNVEIKLIMPNTGQVGGTGLINGSFDIFEPYSLGLFLQSLQSAARRAGFLSYTQDCPFLLKLEFRGWDTNGKDKVIDGAQRYYPIKLTNIKFNANETGSTYNVKFTLFDSVAQFNVHNVLKKTTSLKAAESVNDAFFQLAKALNDVEANLAKNGKSGAAHEYWFKFSPSTSRSGTEDFNFTINGSGAMPFVVDESTKRDAVATTPKGRDFTFKESTPITKVLDEIMLNSKFCKDAVKEENIDKTTGMITWYKINAKAKFIESGYDPVRNTDRMRFEYEIIPYKIHSNIFKQPTAASQGLTEIRKSVRKKFEYMYTGRNDDILKWDLDFKTTFYKAAAVGAYENNPSVDPSAAGGVEFKPRFTADPSAVSAGQVARVTGTYAVQFDTGINKGKKAQGGAYADDIDTMVARNLQTAIMDGNDMITVDLEIMGDTYFLPDDESVQIGDNKYVTPTGAMSHNNSEIRLFLAFRTPIDAPAVGSYFEFPASVYSPFSGLYKVIMLRAMFKDGLFTQSLKIVRDLDQQDEDIQKNLKDPNLFQVSQTGEADPLANSSLAGASNPPPAPTAALPTLPKTSRAAPSGAAAAYAKQQALTQELGKAYANAVNNSQTSGLARENIRKQYEVAAAKLNSMSRG